ncbi:hypothetical protein EBR66_02935 [bacterium]|nr:hypothetical protein [bacterium]
MSEHHSHGKKAAIVATGHTLKRIEEFLFDWLLYGTVTAWCTAHFGTVWGLIWSFWVMMPLSAVISLIYLQVYDKSRRDWLGFELIKEWKDEDHELSWFANLIRKLLHLGSIPAFLILSTHGDPFMVVVYFRHKKNQFNGMTRRDWKIFWTAVLFSNAYWTLRWVIIVEVVRQIYFAASFLR